MILVELRFVHYSPKDSKEGIKEFLIANDEAQAVAYIDNEHMYDSLFEDDDVIELGDEDMESFYPSKEWWESHPGMKEKAIAAGLEVDEYNVSGKSKSITLWYKGTTWQDTDDAYYGVTHWDWSRQRPLNPDEVAMLIELGVAKDIRQWTKESNT